MSGQVKYKKLFEPFKLGPLELKNRIVMPAIAVSFCDDEGRVTQRLIDYYEERAKGGVGLIIAGFASVDYRCGLPGPRKLAIDDDKHLPGLKQLVETVHRYGVKIAVQLHHGGGVAPLSLTGIQPVAPSAVICRPGGDIPRELTVPEIQSLVNRFALAAERGVKAGFDGVEIDAAAGYLLNQFLSSSKNKRRDAYGGDLKNRARFLLEIMRAVRQKVGTGYPLWVKIQGHEYGIPQGITIGEAIELARMLEEEGSIAISVTGFSAKQPFVKTEEPEASAMHLAAAIKKEVGVPVLAVGRMTPAAGERALREGKTDLVAMARALLADPELPLKVASGREDDINQCITCLCCTSLTSNGETGCTVNPALGREGEFRIKRAEKVKKVLVVGGGPAGMEAARIAALRGHDVTLLEKGRELGGQMRLAYRVPHYSRIKDLTLYLARQVTKAGVKVEYDKKLTAADIEARKPDAVVLATGSKISLKGRFIALLILVLARIGYPHIKDEGHLMKSPSRRRQILGVQTPLLAASKPNLELLPLLRGRVSEIYLAGDCLEPSGIMQAVADGARIGHSL